MPAEKQKY